MPEFAYGSEPPQPVPPMEPEHIAQGVTLIRPLSRKGVGPGMIVLSPNEESSTPIEIQDGIPSLRMKWAEEGYCVVEIRPQAASSALKTAVAKLSECQECEPREKIGLVCESRRHPPSTHETDGSQVMMPRCGTRPLRPWRH